MSPWGLPTGGAAKKLRERIMSRAQKGDGNRTAQDAEKKANWKLFMIDLLAVFSLCCGDLSL